MQTNKKIIYSWAMAHGINDWVAGFMLAFASNTMQAAQSVMALILYALLAFGGQLPIGMWLDKNRNLKAFGIIALLLLIVACALFFIQPMLAICIAGIASALLHVTGGCICLMLHKNKFSLLGIFTAPGVAGLAIGGFCGALPVYCILIPMFFVIGLLVIILKNGFPVYKVTASQNNIPDSHDMIMILLLFMMCLRSFLFDLLNGFAINYPYGLLVAGLSAFTGKWIGGYMADAIGWKKWLLISLPAAFILLQIGHNNVLAFGFGVACLQSSVPVTLQLLCSSAPQYPATATALSLGTIIAISGLPLYASENLQHVFAHNRIAYSGIGLVSIIGILAALAWYFFISRKWVKTAA